MAEFITAIKTTAGNKQIDYEALANLPMINGQPHIGNIDISGTSARLSEITILASAWVGNANLYSQVVTIDGVTQYTRVDLNPSVEQMAEFYQAGLAFVTENEDGVVTIYSIGEKPTGDYTMQVTLTEVMV